MISEYTGGKIMGIRAEGWACISMFLERPSYDFEVL